MSVRWFERRRGKQRACVVAAEEVAEVLSCLFYSPARAKELMNNLPCRVLLRTDVGVFWKEESYQPFS